MATLKDISRRLRSVVSIQKITKSMKMVAASKYSRAERDLKHTKAFGIGALDFYDKTKLNEYKLDSEQNQKKDLLVVMSSDKGLCGSIHAGLARYIRNAVKESSNTDYVILGDKVKAMLQRQLSNNFTFTGSNIGKQSMTFGECCKVATELNQLADKYNQLTILYNHFQTVISFKATTKPLFWAGQIENSNLLNNYDSTDSETIRSFQEFNLASILYYAFKENFTCELASRMNAMENASKNAGEFIDKLRLKYNRTRQFVITRELIEIISGASALEEQKQ